MHPVYFRYELLRSFRNWRFIVFSLAYPVVLYFVVTGPQRHAHFDGVAFPLYFMAGMAAVGTMIAVISSGARIAADRSVGWTRQLRITPLTPGDYLGAKVVCGFLMALLAIALVSLSGTALGVRLSAGEWLTMIGLMVVGLVPIAVLGVLLGHVVTPDSLAPAVGGTIMLLALLGGAYGFLVATSGAVFDLIKALPSYWLVQAGKTALGGSGWPAEGWIVIAAWTAVLAPLAVLAYQRDTARV
ncbi:MAG TPA: ABC transporter permease [Solirubrobacteraceae bacterium]|nr:ABC transporter permease [Solirubrobacteraceae bacterium]